MSKDDFLATMRKRFTQAEEEEKALRAEAMNDLRFVAGEQWNPALKQQREAAGRPAMTFNRMHTFVQQVANEGRQMRGEIKFVPAENGDKDTADVYEGLARHIQYTSMAKVAYETALDYSAGGSFGYYRFLTDYCDDDSFNQEVKVVPVFDPFAVYGVLVPYLFGNEPPFAFVIEDISKEDFERDYPNSTVKDWDLAIQQSDGWFREDKVRIAEYWQVKKTPKTIYLTPEGEITEVKPEGESKKRTVYEKSVEFCKTNGVEILDDSETSWVGKRIPIFAVTGKALIVDGKPSIQSIVRFQRDPQQLINFYKTRIAETLATAPIQPYMVPSGSIPEANRKQWETMNTSMRPYIEYSVIDNAGRQVPAPTRQVFEAPIGALSAAAAQEIDGMKAAAGIYDPSLGATGNDNSGIAIARRQQQSNVTNLHFTDNLARSFGESGPELANVLPIIYDTARTIRILGADETPKIVKINQPTEEDGQQKLYKVGGEGVGKYDVIVTMGRAYSTKRMESFDQMGQVIQSAPNLLPMFGDIYFKNSDMAGADEIAERFKKMLPPQLQDEQKGTPEIPPQVQQQMEQAGQMVEQLTQALNEAQNAIETQKFQLESKERIEMAKIEAQKAIVLAELESKEAVEALKAEVQMIAQKVNVNMKQVAADADAAAEEIDGFDEQTYEAPMQPPASSGVPVEESM